MHYIASYRRERLSDSAGHKSAWLRATDDATLFIFDITDVIINV